MTFNENVPLKSNNIADDLIAINDNFSAIKNGNNSFSFENAPFNKQVGDASATTDFIRVFSKDDADGNLELFAIDPSSNVTQLTRQGKSSVRESTTFTPTLKGATNAGSPTYSVNTGSYSLIGDVVHISLRFTVSDVGGATGNWIVENLPFTIRNNSALVPIFEGLRSNIDSTTGVGGAIKGKGIKNTKTMVLDNGVSVTTLTMHGWYFTDEF